MSAARRKAPSPLHVITGALGLFLVILTLLAFQVRAGKDPALSSGTSGTSGASTSSSSTSKTAVKQIVTRTS